MTSWFYLMQRNGVPAIWQADGNSFPKRDHDGPAESLREIMDRRSKPRVRCFQGEPKRQGSSGISRCDRMVS